MIEPSKATITLGIFIVKLCPMIPPANKIATMAKIGTYIHIRGQSNTSIFLKSIMNRGTVNIVKMTSMESFKILFYIAEN